MVDDEPVVLRLNGRDVPLPGTSPTATLLHAVRERGLVGTKEGCGDGDCGACTVVVLEPGPDGLTHRAVNSCLVPVGSVVGLDVVTVEGVADQGRGPLGGAGLHPVQQAMVDCAGSQCGYCTPGFVMSMYAGYHDPALRGPDGLDEAVVEGNLCRCTGYAAIRRACRRLRVDPHDPPDRPDRGDHARVHRHDRGDHARVHREVVEPARAGAPVHEHGGRGGGRGGGTVAAAGRTFHRPTTLDDALELLAAHPDAVLLAGGTDLGLELSHHRLDPAVVVSLEAVPELQLLEVTGRHLRVGAGVTLTRVEREAAGLVPALDEMVRWFAARQVRNRATLGGNLGTASPIGDLPPVLLALDAELVLRSAAGRRTVAVDGFFTGYRTTLRAADEVVERVDLPLRGADGTTRLQQSYKVGKRGTDDISIVAAAFVVDLADDGTVAHARMGYGGVAATPVRARDAERALLGRTLDEATVDRVAALLRDTFSPLDDLRAGAAYRRQLVGGLFEKFCAEHAPGGRPAPEHQGALV